MIFHTYIARVESNGREAAEDSPTRWVSVAGFRRLSVSRAYRKVFENARSQVSVENGS